MPLTIFAKNTPTQMFDWVLNTHSPKDAREDLLMKSKSTKSKCLEGKIARAVSKKSKNFEFRN